MTYITNAFTQAMTRPQVIAPQVVTPQVVAPVAGNASIPTGFVPAVQTQAYQAPAAGAQVGTAQGGGIVDTVVNTVKDGLSGVVGFFKNQSDKAANDLATKGVNRDTGEVDQALLVASKKWETAYSTLSAAEKSRFDAEKETAMMWARG